ncbi:MAG: copper amine oxidase N-terminal domain-containing protein, partial [Clostridiales bacterium]|nr:copper amine oxidase N-terminal domain-containing protein [Clostridiales bacterium]
MKKKALLICLLVFVLASSVFAAQNFESIHGMFSGYRIVRIIVDGREIKGDVPGIIVEGRTMVPVRFIVDALGGQIEWDESTFTVNIETTVEGEEVENYDP